MNTFRRTPPAPTPTPTIPQPRSYDPATASRQHRRRAFRLIGYGILTGAATTAGKAIMDAALWLVQNH